MTIFIGKGEYSPYKPYRELNYDPTAVNSDISIVQGKAQIIDGDCLVFFAAKSISNLWKKEDFSESELYYCHFHSKQYERWTKENPKAPTEPSPLELALIEYLQGDGRQFLEKPFKGNLCLNGSPSIVETVRASKAWPILAKLETIDEAPLLKEVAKSSGGASKKGFAGQTEAQRLDDRLKFLIANLGSYSEGVTNLQEFAMALHQMGKDSSTTEELWSDWMMRLISPR